MEVLLLACGCGLPGNRVSAEESKLRRGHKDEGGVTGQLCQCRPEDSLSDDEFASYTFSNFHSQKTLAAHLVS